MQYDKNNTCELSDCIEAEAVVLKLLKAVFADEQLEKKDYKNADWRGVFKELEVQAVSMLPIDKLAQLEDLIDLELFEEQIEDCAQLISFNETLLQCQEELTALFWDNDIPMVILKGAAAACYYPNPLYRNMGDIDFLVDKADFDRAYTLMKNSGYRLAYDENHVDYHLTFKKDNMIYELHREPAGLSEGSKQDMIRELFEDCCKNAQKSEIAGYQFYRFPRLQNGLVLLLHIVKHLDDGLGLRQICDWLAFVNAELNDEVWKNEFSPVLKKAGLEKIACIATKTGKMYIGLKQDITWCDDTDERLCSDFMRFVFSGGKGGRN